MDDLASPRHFAAPTGAHAARQAAVAGMVALAVVLGIGRFAFTPLLPLMLHGGGLDIRHGGWLASCNYAGYFLGAVTCAALRVEPARMVRSGLALTVFLTLAMGLTGQFWIWAVVRFAAGVVSAWTFVFASQWGLRRLAELNAHGWSGVIYAGPGVGIVATGLFVSVAGASGARVGWLGFGLAAAVLSALVWGVFDVGHKTASTAAHPTSASTRPFLRPRPIESTAPPTPFSWSFSTPLPALATSSRRPSFR